MTRIRVISLLFLVLFPASCAPAGALALSTPRPISPITATPLPPSGRIAYVIDPRNGDLLTQIFVIAVDRYQVIRSFPTRFTPEISFTPDGRRMYVADSYSTQVIRGEHHDVLSVYNALTGDLLHDDVEIPKRLLYKEFPNPYPFTFLSHDGKRVFVGQYGDPDVHAMRLTVLDAATFALLAEYAHPDCTLVPLKSGELLCNGQGGVRLVDPLSGDTTSIPEPPPTEPAPPSPARAWTLSPNDRLYRLWFDSETQAHIQVMDLAAKPPHIVVDHIPLDIPRKGFTAINRVTLAPDESRLYVVLAVGELIDQYTPTEIWAFDTRSWTRVGIFQTRDPAWQIAVSQDGKRLYAVDPFKRSFSIFDTETFRELGVIPDLGDSPALIVVPPQGLE